MAFVLKISRILSRLDIYLKFVTFKMIKTIDVVLEIKTEIIIIIVKLNK